MNYQKAIQMNYEHMGSHPVEWLATPVTGVVEADDGDGGSVSMPTFDFPVDYSRPPSLYTGGDCCNLCGTRIRNVYWIQNDKRKWIMPVGSECVTHFGTGESGERLAKEVLWAKNRQLLVEVIELRWAIWKTFSKRVNMGYSRYETGIFPHKLIEKRALRCYQSLKKVTGTLTSESTNAAVTRWAKKHKDTIHELMGEANQLLEERQAQKSPSNVMT